MHHVAIVTAIPTMLWGSPTWWNGTQAIVDRLLPAYHSLARSVCQAKSFTRRASLYCDSGLPPLDLLLDQTSQRYGIRILLYSPAHPLAARLFEALRLAPSRVFPHGTGLVRIATLLYKLNVFTNLGPSHAIWLSSLSPAQRSALHRSPTDILLRLWQTRYPTGNPSPAPPPALAGLRRHQACVIAQWRSRTTPLDPPPWIVPGPACECGEPQSSEHALLVCPKYDVLRRGFLAGLARPVLFDDIVLDPLQIFPLLAFLKRANLFSGSASTGPMLLMDAVM